jgi:hypothetical protein
MLSWLESKMIDCLVQLLLCELHAFKKQGARATIPAV